MALLLSSWEANQRNGQPKAAIRVRNLQASSKAGKDAWGRTGILQPVLISASVSLHDHFQSASEDDEVDTSTIHYGVLSKTILEAVKLFNEAEFEEASNLRDLLDHILPKMAEWNVDRINIDDCSPPILDARKVRSTELKVMLPKASLSGHGVSLRAIACYDRESADHTGYSLALKLHDLSIPTLIGVNSNERLAKQIIIANIEIEEWDLRFDAYNELEEIVVKVFASLSFI
jgi:dihydroneopterin aldolase